MGMKKKRMVGSTIMIAVLTLFSIVYIYPVFLMFMNAFKPFGEVVSDPIAWPKQPTWENYSYVIDKIKYGQLFMNNVIITVIGIAGIVIFSSLAAYILDRRPGRYTKLVYTIIITPMLIPFQTIMITLLKAMSVIRLSNSRIGLGIQYWGFEIGRAHV